MCGKSAGTILLLAVTMSLKVVNFFHKELRMYVLHFYSGGRLSGGELCST